MSPELDKPAQRIPEGAIRLPDITIGGKTPQQLSEALASDGRVRVGSNWARDILTSPDFTTLPKPQTLSLVKVSLKNLGLNGVPSTDQIYARANKYGLEVCPAEVGPYLRLAYKKPVTESESFCVAMKPIPIRDWPCVFWLYHSSYNYQLDALNIRDSNPPWRSWYEFVFSVCK